MRYLSVCSGIEAATVAWHPLGWEAAAFSEIEAFPRAVLQHHYPHVPLHGDFTTIGADEYGAIDLLVGGTPCQSFSVAGLRKGLDDPRGNLALAFLQLLDRTRARWVVWENVPGVLSSGGGRDFGAFLGGLAELGYGFAYRVLDAQFFGVPQRRRRVFVVGHLGDWRRAAAVLFERHSLSGHLAPRREKGEESAASTGFSTVGSLSGGYGSKLGTDESCQESVIPATAYQTSGNCGAWETGQITGALDTNTDPNSTVIAFAQNTRDEIRFVGGDGQIVGALAAEPGMKQQSYVAFNITPSNSNKDYNARESERAQALTAGGNRPSARGGDLIALQGVNCPRQRKQNGIGISEGEAMYSLTSRDLHGVANASAVRRLTPRECERLQGFPDDYTLIPYRGKQAADGPRYKALGNSMAVPVMAWIGERIAQVEALPRQMAAAA